MEMTTNKNVEEMKVLTKEFCKNTPRLKEESGVAFYERLLATLLHAHNEGYKAGQSEERQFILNILEGIDIADGISGNKGGGTKAIRFALASRTIGKELKVSEVYAYDSGFKAGLEKAVEMVGEKKKYYKHTRGSHADDFSDTEPCDCDRQENEIYNQAIDDLTSHLTQLITSNKN